MKNENDSQSDTPKEPERQNVPTVEEAIGMFRGAVADVLAALEPLPPHPEWERILAQWGKREALAIQQGQKAGVPEAYLRRFAAGVVERELRGGDFKFAADFMRNHGLGTPELIAHFAELGRRQKEDARAKKAESANRTPPQKFIHLPSPEATMADLFKSLRSSPQSLQDHFENDLEDQYDWLHMPFFDLEKDPAKASGTTVADFFGESGYDIETALPLLKFASGNEKSSSKFL